MNTHQHRTYSDTHKTLLSIIGTLILISIGGIGWYISNLTAEQAAFKDNVYQNYVTKPDLKDLKTDMNNNFLLLRNDISELSKEIRNGNRQKNE